MNVPYKNLRPSIYEKIDELEAAGRTRSAACTELRNMVRDGAVSLLDNNNPPFTDEWVRQAAFTVIDAIRQNSQTIPAGCREYLEKVYVIDWAEIDKAVGAAIIEKESAAPASPTGIQTNKQAAAKAKCIAWISAMPVQPARRKPNVEAEAKVAFPKLSGRQFNAAWDEAAPAAWKKPGPK